MAGMDNFLKLACAIFALVLLGISTALAAETLYDGGIISMKRDEVQEIELKFESGSYQMPGRDCVGITKIDPQKFAVKFLKPCDGELVFTSIDDSQSISYRIKDADETPLVQDVELDIGNTATWYFEKRVDRIEIEEKSALSVLANADHSYSITPKTLTENRVTFRDADGRKIAVLTYLKKAENDGRGQFVRIGLNKAIVISLPKLAKNVVVGNSEIARVAPTTNANFQVFARKIGQTNVFFFDSEGNQILNLDLEVSLDTLALNKAIDRLVVDNGISADSVQSVIILTGSARNQAEVTLAFNLAQAFVDSSSEQQIKVINAIKLSKR
jgi:Flp pilus assembly secretin CpaC